MPLALNQICRLSSSTLTTLRTTHSPLVIWFFTRPAAPSYKYRWFQPSRSDIQMISWPAFFTSWLNFLQLLKNVLGSSEITARGFPVAASTSIIRMAWCPRCVYSKATVRLSWRHVSRDITYGFGKSSFETMTCRAGLTWNTRGWSRSTASPGLAYNCVSSRGCT